MTAHRAVRAKRLVTGLGVGLVALLLSACGARIDTQLTVDAEGAGSRVMTLTLAEDQDGLVGGAAAADASIARHKPAQVDYSGLTTGPTGELVATFTVPFASPEEYTQDMVALLAAGDREWSQENAFVVEQTPFVKGATIEERFGSQDVLQWMFSGLLADGVVEESNSANMFEIGATTVTFNGVAYEAGNPISFSEVEDRGFASVEMATAFTDDGFSRVLTYHLADKAVYNSAKDVFDGFFSDLEAGGASVEQDAEQVGITWRATLSAESPEELVELTDAALTSEETAFDVTTGTLEEDPATATITVTDYAECAAICSPDASPITEALTVPAAFELVSGGELDEEGNVAFEMSPSGAEQLFHAVYPFRSVTTELSVGTGGGLTWSGEFVVDAGDAAAVDDGFRTLLAPPDGGGDIDVTTTDDTAVYTVTLEGADAEEFSQSYRAWSGVETTGVTVTEMPGANLFAVDYLIAGDLGFSPVVGVHLPAEGVQHSVELPFGQGFDTESVPVPEATVVDGSRLTLAGPGAAIFSAAVSGTSLAGLVTYAVLLGVLLVGLVLAVVFRTRIAAAIARRKEAARERAAAMPTAGAAAPGTVAAAHASTEAGHDARVPDRPAPAAAVDPHAEARRSPDVDYL